MRVDLGDRIRDARKAKGMSLRALAAELGVSPSFISQVETNKSQPSVSTLYALTNHLGLSVDDLLKDPSAAPESGQVASAPSGTERVEHVGNEFQRGVDNPKLVMENGVLWERLATAPGDPVEPLLVTYEPGATGAVDGKLVRHSGWEYAYLIEGELELQLEFETIVLRAGDSLQFDSTRPHVYLNRSDRPARGLWFVLGRRQAFELNPVVQDDVPRTNQRMNSVSDVLRAFGAED